MGRFKREPYNPAKVHDRRATGLNRGVTPHVIEVEVDDPYDHGEKVRVIRHVRNDPLGDLFSHHFIDQAQYDGGRQFQDDFETAERGPRAIDPGKECVDGGLAPEPITEAQRRAARSLARAHRELGANGSAIAHDVLIHGKNYSQVAESRGLSGRRWEEYFGIRFRECLDCLALVYGFATR